jgi:hypothetical protein
LNTLTQGLQASSFQITVVDGASGPNKRGVSGPNITIACTGVSDAKWPGPLSLVTSTSAMV